VHLVGVSNEELVAYYELADVFSARASTKGLRAARRVLHMGVR
jgi:hypothetical protein